MNKVGIGGFTVTGLKTEFVDAPRAIEIVQPRLSWRLESSRRGIIQSSYRVVARLGGDAGDSILWDSDWVNSDQSIGIEYLGRPLKSRECIYWTASVRDDSGTEATSDPASFEMGLLDPTDWQGDWIEAELESDRERRLKGEVAQTEPGVLIRKQFQLDKPALRARLYATALGAYEACLNGARVGKAMLAPEISAIDHHVYYQVHDITDALLVGPNTIGLHVGDGYYAGRFYGSNAPRFAFGPGPRRVRAFLVATHEDGSSTVVGTGPDWKLASSAVVSSSLYDGESHDARLELEGWDCIGFDETDWQPVNCSIGALPAKRFIGQNSPSIEAMERIAPISQMQLDETTRIYDFGRNFAGLCKLTTQGGAGDQLTMRFAEHINADGTLDIRSLRTAKVTDQYVLKGAPEGESWTPAFTYHGFQYASLSGALVRDGNAELEGVVVGSNCRMTGQLRFPASPLLQGVWNNSLQSQRSNFVSIPTDCPQRDERAGWLGDIQLFLDAAAFNMDVNAFIRRFLNEIRATQEPDGAVVSIAPVPVGVRADVSSGWSEACVVLPWTLYQRYSDTRVIEDNWEAMERWMYYIQSVNPDGLWRHRRGWDLGDWLSVDAKDRADETTPKLLCATAYWAYTARMMMQMARAIGRSKSAEHYEMLRRHIETSFAQEFVHKDGSVGNGSQTGYVLALHFGLVPESLRFIAAKKLADDIIGRGTKLSTGILGTTYLPDALADNGRADVAVNLLLQTEYPSWGYMVRKGATTMWESWDSDTKGRSESPAGHMNSYNHYMLGAVAGFMYRRLAGIAPAAPGFRRISVRPLFDSRIGPVEGTYDSVAGRIATRTDGNESGLTRLHLEIPANTTAEVHLPSGSWRERDGTDLQTETNSFGQIRFCIGSGCYDFSSC